MKTMICIILDRSGSMGGRENDVINGVNSFIAKQKLDPEPTSIALVRFDTEAIERFRAMGPLGEVMELTGMDYQPRGGTPLLDAVGRTIIELDDDWKREQPDRAIVVIVTDGEENSSREYSKEKIKQLIEAREGSKLWAFIYLGANVDAFVEGAKMGIRSVNTAGYAATPQGIAQSFSTVSATASAMKFSGVMDAFNLGGNIAEDGTLVKAPTAGSSTVPVPTWVPPSTGSAPTPPLIWSPPA